MSDENATERLTFSVMCDARDSLASMSFGLVDTKLHRPSWRDIFIHEPTTHEIHDLFYIIMGVMEPYAFD